MSYGVFLVINIAVLWLALLVIESTYALNGPVAIACVAYFWISHYFFVSWRMNDAPLQLMSDRQLQSLLGEWTKGPFWHHVSQLTTVRREHNDLKTIGALKRLIAIYEELIRRVGTEEIDALRISDLKRGLENLKTELKSYQPHSPPDIRTSPSPTDVAKISVAIPKADSPPAQPPSLSQTPSPPSTKPDRSWHSPFGQLSLLLGFSPEHLMPGAIDAAFLNALAVHDFAYKNADDEDTLLWGQKEAELLAEAQCKYPHLTALYEEQAGMRSMKS